MLAVTSYAEVYVRLTAAKVEEQLAQYAALAKAVKGNAAAEAALAGFAPGYFNSMILALDHHFMHRMRSAEGKDGNPLNEVRMLSDSIMEHDGVLKENKTIKYKPERAGAGVAVGRRLRSMRSGSRGWRGLMWRRSGGGFGRYLALRGDVGAQRREMGAMPVFKPRN